MDQEEQVGQPNTQKYQSLKVQRFLSLFDELGRNVELTKQQFAHTFDGLLKLSKPTKPIDGIKTTLLSLVERDFLPGLYHEIAEKNHQIMDIFPAFMHDLSQKDKEQLLNEIKRSQEETKENAIKKIWKDIESSLTTSRVVTSKKEEQKDPELLVIEQYKKAGSYGQLVMVRDSSFTYLSVPDTEPAADSTPTFTLKQTTTGLPVLQLTSRSKTQEIGSTELFTRDWRDAIARLDKLQQNPKFVSQAKLAVAKSRVFQITADDTTYATIVSDDTQQYSAKMISVKADSNEAPELRTFWSSNCANFASELKSTFSFVSRFRLKDMKDTGGPFADPHLIPCVLTNARPITQPGSNRHALTYIQSKRLEFGQLDASSESQFWEVRLSAVEDSRDYENIYIEEFVLYKDHAAIYISNPQANSGLNPQLKHALVVMRLPSISSVIQPNQISALRTMCFEFDSTQGNFCFLRPIVPSRSINGSEKLPVNQGVFFAAFSKRSIVIYSQPVFFQMTGISGSRDFEVSSRYKTAITGMKYVKLEWEHRFLPDLRRWPATEKRTFISADGYLHAPLYYVA